MRERWNTVRSHSLKAKTTHNIQNKFPAKADITNHIQKHHVYLIFLILYIYSFFFSWHSFFMLSAINKTAVLCALFKKSTPEKCRKACISHLDVFITKHLIWCKLWCFLSARRLHVFTSPEVNDPAVWERLTPHELWNETNVKHRLRNIWNRSSAVWLQRPTKQSWLKCAL